MHTIHTTADLETPQRHTPALHAGTVGPCAAHDTALVTSGGSVARRLARVAAAAALCALATGCLQIDGEHHVAPYGDPDSGRYAIAMDSAVHAALLADKPDAFDSLRRYSRPQTIRRDGQVIVADVSGQAQMEHFYEQFSCQPTAGRRGWMDCRFSMSDDDLTFMGWRVDWKVVLEPGMEVLRSNHHRLRTVGGAQQLIWNFDGNKVNAYDISFVLRVPKA